MISLTAERIIRDKVTKPLVANGQQTGSKKVTKTSKENNELIVTLRREIEDLKSQRDKQLATKDRQIDHLRTCLESFQEYSQEG
ncbi:replication protein RepB [Lactiplantibacillus plantarum]|nr:replication protein RepB [Lactiplantibacillus plantarum]